MCSLAPQLAQPPPTATPRPGIVWSDPDEPPLAAFDAAIPLADVAAQVGSAREWNAWITAHPIKTRKGADRRSGRSSAWLAHGSTDADLISEYDARL